MAAFPHARSSDCMTCERRCGRMFCNLSQQELQDFDRIGVQVRLPRGGIIFHEDDPGSTVSVVCSGQVKLSCTSREGRTLILKIAVPGDVLGLGAVISGSNYELTAEALEPVLLKNVRREEFIAFLESHVEASMHAARALSEEYKSAFFDARRLALAPSAAGRLASVLLDWARHTCTDAREMRFTMALTHEELANLAGTSRETVTRVLSRFQREKLIQIKGASITLLAPETLEAMS